MPVLKRRLVLFFHRQYTNIQALNDINFKINAGEIVGYIGPNGAGKSTTIKIMSGILRPDQGDTRINGIDPFKSRKVHAANIGVVFGQRSQLWWDIPVIDSFELLRDMYNINHNVYQQRITELIDLFQIATIVQMPTRQLSLGQRMRCEIVAAMIHNPPILFLDEPTIGLDAPAKVVVRQLIKTLNQKYKTTVILTTHDMQDIESLASRIMVIGHGSIVFDGTMNTLKKQYHFQQYLKVSFNQGNLDDTGLVINDHDHSNATILVDRPIQDIINIINQAVTIIDFEIIQESIDDVILKMYQELSL